MRNAIVLASILLLALLVWLGFVRRSAQGPSVEAPHVPAHEMPASSASSLEVDVEGAHATPLDARAPSEGDEQAQLAAEREAGEELWVVAAETKAPLAGVRVSCLEFDLSQRARWFARPQDLEGIRHVEREGVARTSGERGLARIPAPRERLLVLARSEERFGMLWIEPETPRPWTLELALDGAWLARATDALGAPIQGLWIGLHGGARRELMRARTDAQGLARFEHARYAMSRSDGEEFELLPRALLAAPVRATWSGLVPPAEPTELRLPRLGLVEVALRDPADEAWAPWDESAWVREAQAVPTAQPTHAQASVGLDTRGEDGLRTHAQHGLTVEACLSSMAIEEPITALGEHPVRAGELLRIELVLGAVHPIARMRLVDARGAPLPNELVEVRRQIARGGQHSTSIARMSSDARAQLLVPLSPPSAGARRVLSIALPRDERLQAVLEVPDEPLRGWIECGDVQLVQAPVLAAGRVVDSTGAPVAGARVDVQTATMRMASSRADAAWNFAAGPSWSVQSDADGTFALHSFERPERVRAAAKSGGAYLALANWVEGEPGRSDYELALPAATKVEGRVLLPEGLRADELQLVLKRAGGSGSGPRLAVDGSWSASGLEPGTWTIEARPSSAPEVLASVEVELVADQTVRAVDLDLREVRVLRIEIVDEGGEPIDAQGSYSAPRAKRAHDLYAARGRARIVTALARVDASFEAPGRLRATAIDVQDGARVELARGLPLRVRLRDASVLPSAPWVLVAWLSGGGGEAAFDVAGEALVLGARAGEQRLQVGLRERARLWDDDGGASPVLGAKSLGFAVTLSAEGETPDLMIDVEAEQVARALRELEGRRER